MRVESSGDGYENGIHEFPVTDDFAVDLLQIVESTTLDAQQIAARTAQIRAAVLSTSNSIDAGNFTRIRSADLELLFDAYDGAFFGGNVRNSLGTAPLCFSFSKRMTSAGGKTAGYTDHRSGRRRYDISISLPVLFACFHEDDHRPIVTSGILCRDRLDALQRVMEHELVHVIELLVWNKSSCSQARFHSITRRVFGHTENRHRLITPRERAIVKYGIKPGMPVRFRFDGVEHTGRVNRINKRATVLVEDSRGVRYTNGRCYAKFYVPVQCLEVIE